MVMTHALVNFSPQLKICSWLELKGKWMISTSGMGGRDNKSLAGSAHDCGCVVDGSGAMAAS